MISHGIKKTDVLSDAELSEQGTQSQIFNLASMAGDQKCISANQDVTIKVTVAYCLCKTCKMRLTVGRMQ